MKLVDRIFFKSKVRSLRDEWSASERSKFWYGASVGLSELDRPESDLEQIAGLNDIGPTSRGEETGA